VKFQDCYYRGQHWVQSQEQDQDGSSQENHQSQRGLRGIQRVKYKSQAPKILRRNGSRWAISSHRLGIVHHLQHHNLLPRPKSPHGKTEVTHASIVWRA